MSAASSVCIVPDEQPVDPNAAEKPGGAINVARRDSYDGTLLVARRVDGAFSGLVMLHGTSTPLSTATHRVGQEAGGIFIGSRPSRVPIAVPSGNDPFGTTTMLNATRTAALCALAATLAIGSPAGAARSCEFRGAFGTRSSEPDRPRPVRFLTDVRAGAHRCFDRAAFEFQTEGVGAPGYRVAYEEDPIREDGSGRPVPVRGDAFLVVRLSPARDTDISTADSPRSTYRGPNSVEPRGGRRIIEVRHVSSFEGTVKWAIGVDRRRPFRVTTLPSPPRIVIDVG